MKTVSVASQVVKQPVEYVCCPNRIFDRYGLYSDHDERSFLGDGSTRVVPIPNMADCMEAASRQPQVKLRGLLKSAANGDK